jgi:hypothetical protein
MNHDLVFPSDWPACCPPDDAIEASGAAYRITKNDPPTDDDFLSHHERGLPSPLKQTRAQECRRRAVSIYRTIEDAKHHTLAFPSSGQNIAAGVLTARSGRTKLHPSDERPTHTEWWCFVGIERKAGFAIVH